jgi:hypothetical protein
MFLYSVPSLLALEKDPPHANSSKDELYGKTQKIENHGPLEIIHSDSLDKFGRLYVPETINPNCSRLTVYFPGHAQSGEVKKPGGGYYSKTIPSEGYEKWSKTLLDHPNYSLRETVEKSGCPVFFVGSTELRVPSSIIKEALRTSKSSEIHLAAHSGGYKGLNESLKYWSENAAIDQRQIKSISLLDCFYGGTKRGSLYDTLNSYAEKYNWVQKKMIRGFFTDQSNDYSQTRSIYQDIASLKKETGYNSHKTKVKNHLFSWF